MRPPGDPREVAPRLLQAVFSYPFGVMMFGRRAVRTLTAPSGVPAAQCNAIQIQPLQPSRGRYVVGRGKIGKKTPSGGTSAAWGCVCRGAVQSKLVGGACPS